MRVLRNVVTGRVKTISAWAKYFEKMREEGVYPASIASENK